MFVRVTRAPLAPEQVDERIARYPELIRPLTTLDGYLGAAVLIDRSAGEGVSVTYWASAEALQASEEAGASVRTQAGMQLLDLDRFELVIQERTAPPRSGTFVRSNDIQGSPAKVDDLIAFARDQILPVLKTQPGFRANLVGVNRETGRILASSIWETAADREASESALRELRDEAGRLGGAEQVTVRLYESVYVAITVPTPA